MTQTAKNNKNANAELLRLTAMCMIVMLHGLDKGGSLARLFGDSGVNGYIAWFMEALCAPAVNAFMLLSGYYLSKSRFRLGRLIELVAMTCFYSLVSLAVCIPLGIDTLKGRTVGDLLYYFFPIHNKLYWFMAVYTIIYMLSPLINRALDAINEWQHKAVIILLVIYECVFKSFLPGRFEPDDRGFGVVWLLTVYIIGSFIRKYGFKVLTTPIRGALLYLLVTVAVFAEELVIQYIYATRGRLMYALEVSYDYNHVFMLLSALGLFALFMNKKQPGETASKVICALSPMALGVYLAHENLSLRYDWQAWFGIKDILPLSPVMFVLRLILAVLAVFACGLAIDFVRIKIFDLIKKLFKESRISKAIASFDEKMNAGR